MILPRLIRIAQISLLGLCLTPLLALQAYAQDYPARAIKMVVPQPPGGGANLMAQNVSACTITYNAANQRIGVVSMWLQLSDSSGARVNLFQEVQVNNSP